MSKEELRGSFIGFNLSVIDDFIKSFNLKLFELADLFGLLMLPVPVDSENK